MALFRKKRDKKSDLTLPPVGPSISAPPPVAESNTPAAPVAERKPDSVEPWSLAAGVLATLRCSLGSDATVSGRLSFTKPTRLDGTLRGEVRASDLLVIGETGFVDGAVHAAHLVILGRVNGDVHGAETVEVASCGTLNGNVEARYLIVQEGGSIEGDCRIHPPARPVAPVPVPPVADDFPPADARVETDLPPADEPTPVATGVGDSGAVVATDVATADSAGTDRGEDDPTRSS